MTAVAETVRTMGRYELVRPLGRGGMAEVFLARRRGPAGIEKRLVVKRIRPERAGDPRFLALFLREARLSVTLAHANIVPVFDFGRAGEELFLAMEHVDGRDLGAALSEAARTGRPLDPLLVAHVGAEACRALDYAHRRKDDAGKPLGVVHRDVTPRNLLLSFEGEVKLTDFGVAALASGDGDGELGKVHGTPAYMAPEQARGEAVDGRADLFSLGLVLWEALAGRRANAEMQPRAALVCARRGEVPPLPDTVPTALRAAIAAATAADPAARPADARVMQAALEAFVIAGRAADPKRATPGQELAAWVRALFPEDAAEVSGEGAFAVPEGPVVTFADDGEEALARAFGGSAGAETMRSLLATAAGTALDLPPAVATGADPVSALSAPPVLPSVLPSAAASTAPTASSRRPPLVLVGGALAVIALAAVAFVVTRGGGAHPAPAVLAPVDASQRSVALAARLDARPAAPPDAHAPVAPPAPDARPVVVLPDARPVPHHVPTATSQPHAPVVTAHVQINSVPWSFITVDADPTRREPPVELDLPLGRHTLHFDNPDQNLHAERTIQVVPNTAPIIERFGQ